MYKRQGSGRPDLGAVTTATTDAVAATVRLAKERARSDDGWGHGAHADRGREGGGLVPVVQNLVGGLVTTMGGVVSGLNGLVNGLIGALVGGG